MMIPDKVIQWLLDSAPWTSYMTRKELLHEHINSEQTNKAIDKILADEKVIGLMNDLQDWFPNIAKAHTDAKLSHYKLRMLSDFGLSKNNVPDKIISQVKGHQNEQYYAIRQYLPTKKPDLTQEWNALPCDNPVILYTLLKLGENDAETEKQIELLKEKWTTKDGWFCHLPFVDGQYKKEHIGCPMAGLTALEVFSQFDELKESVFAQNAYQTIHHHYEIGKSIYYFGRGRKFHTCKYPFIWYNALYMADVLTRFPFVKKEQLVSDLIGWVKRNCDADGKYTPTSIYLEYKNWDFGDKKNPSPWMTYLCYKVLDQYEQL